MFVDGGEGECFDCDHTWQEKTTACPKCGATGDDANFLDPTEMMVQCFECDHKWPQGISEPEALVVGKGKEQGTEVEYIGQRAKGAAYPKWLAAGMSGYVVKHFKLASGSSAPVGVKFASKTVYIHYCDIMIPTEESKQTKVEKFQLDQMLKKVEAFAGAKGMDGDTLEAALNSVMSQANDNFKWVRIDETNEKVIEMRKKCGELNEKAEAMRKWKEEAAAKKLAKLKEKYKANATKMVQDAKSQAADEGEDTKISWEKNLRGLKEICLKAIAPWKTLWQVSPSNKTVQGCILAWKGGSDFIEDFGFKKDTEWGTGNYEMEEDKDGRRSVPNPNTIRVVVYGMLDDMCPPNKKELEKRMKMGTEWATMEFAKEGVDCDAEEYEGPPPKPAARVWGKTYDERCQAFLQKSIEDAEKCEDIFNEAAQTAREAGKSLKIVLKKIKSKPYKKAIAALEEVNNRLNPPEPVEEKEEPKEEPKKKKGKGKKKRRKSKVDKG